MAPPIAVDSSQLTAAATLYETANSSASHSMKTLTGVLDAHWGCAGSDSAGASWAASYDPAAFQAIAAGNNLVNSFAKIHDLLGATATNHVNTEKANKQPPEPPGPDAPQLPPSTADTFKGAFGGDTDPPFGWSMVSSWLQGHTWPNGNPDKLRALASGWRAAATGLREASAATGTAWANLEDIASGEMPQALAQMDLVFTEVEAVADQYETLASACTDWAQQIEDAHRKILHILAGALGAGLIIGGVAGFFTAGAGTVAAAGAAGSAAGASIVTVLVAFDAAAAVAVGTTVAAGVAAAGVATDLQPLLAANPTQFNADSGGLNGDHKYVPPPKDLAGFPGARSVPKVGPRFRTRWKDGKGNLYEWDYQHGRVEKYTKNNKHLGEFDPVTGEQTKPPKAGRIPGR